MTRRMRGPKTGVPRGRPELAWPRLFWKKNKRKMAKKEEKPTVDNCPLFKRFKKRFCATYTRSLQNKKRALYLLAHQRTTTRVCCKKKRQQQHFFLRCCCSVVEIILNKYLQKTNNNNSNNNRRKDDGFIITLSLKSTIPGVLTLLLSSDGIIVWRNFSRDAYKWDRG